MNPQLASSLARARQRHILDEAAERRRLKLDPEPSRPGTARHRLGRGLVALGRSVVALGEALAPSR